MTTFLYWGIGNFVMDGAKVVDGAKTAILIFAQFGHVLLKYVPTFKSRDKLQWACPLHRGAKKGAKPGKIQTGKCRCESQ